MSGEDSEEEMARGGMNGTDEETAEMKTYECEDCGHRMKADHQPVKCPECGGNMIDISVSRE